MELALAQVLAVIFFLAVIVEAGFALFMGSKYGGTVIDIDDGRTAPMLRERDSNRIVDYQLASDIFLVA
ncbi:MULTISPECIES: hypothetical protein [unclassified Enterococcus]|uniref:hypothetical protein n=1 Tax=unclassified Enterococcus TaxID=2608891 RepID=UPI001554F21C|nr:MULTISPECIES: hypothetical protein [unclassified Enterococcus]MBS7576682.1 hypothetical protein [Enterococcus sp. MMGLQ5-2]MBS7583831.1 hypothetical protein [Enterococcus sp. MMGLQ5-1]NPD11692.1 hypothetical protein [Enterococcus sp. MMGLQ5-1]NPD36519.1 hypothetical protein [Enterococcus sp. MMGLQ5-2]